MDCDMYLDSLCLEGIEFRVSRESGVAAHLPDFSGEYVSSKRVRSSSYLFSGKLVPQLS